MCYIKRTITTLSNGQKVSGTHVEPCGRAGCDSVRSTDAYRRDPPPQRSDGSHYPASGSRQPTSVGEANIVEVTPSPKGKRRPRVTISHAGKPAEPRKASASSPITPRQPAFQQCEEVRQSMQDSTYVYVHRETGRSVPPAPATPSCPRQPSTRQPHKSVPVIHQPQPNAAPKTEETEDERQARIERDRGPGREQLRKERRADENFAEQYLKRAAAREEARRKNQGRSHEPQQEDHHRPTPPHGGAGNQQQSRPRDNLATEPSARPPPASSFQAPVNSSADAAFESEKDVAARLLKFEVEQTNRERLGTVAQHAGWGIDSARPRQDYHSPHLSMPATRHAADDVNNDGYRSPRTLGESGWARGLAVIHEAQHAYSSRERTSTSYPRDTRDNRGPDRYR